MTQNSNRTASWARRGIGTTVGFRKSSPAVVLLVRTLVALAILKTLKISILSLKFAIFSKNTAISRTDSVFLRKNAI